MYVAGNRVIYYKYTISVAQIGIGDMYMTGNREFDIGM